jgi:hypothetical protein
VEEQSHKDEMRAALRGDFERMRRRQARDDGPIGRVAATPVVAAVSQEDSLFAQPSEPSASWLDRLLGRA